LTENNSVSDELVDNIIPLQDLLKVWDRTLSTRTFIAGEPNIDIFLTHKDIKTLLMLIDGYRLIADHNMLKEPE